MADFVRPRTLPGFQDFLPSRQMARLELIQRVRTVYERHGFSPIDTPALEYREVLLGQGEVEKEIYHFVDDDDNQVGLRFDLTVPLARVCSEHSKQLVWPLRVYHCANVWRAEKHKPGRFREFAQFDADIVGEPAVWADVEILTMVHRTLCAIGMSDSLIKISHRGILQALIAKAGIDEQQSFGVLRTLDKLDRLGWEKVRLLLGNAPQQMVDGIDAPPLGLSTVAVDTIERFLAIRGDALDQLAQLVEFFHGVERADEALSDLRNIVEALPANDVPADAFCIDLSIARGLDYYTGMIFEAMLRSAPQIGTVFGGGRYDGLVGRFSKRSLPATGASIGVDRVMAAMEMLGLIQQRPSTAEVLIVVFDDALRPECFGIAAQLRGAGINTVLYSGTRKIKHQFKHGDDLGVRVVVLLGSDELNNGTVQIRSMAGEFVDKDNRSKQTEVPRERLVPEVLSLLGRGE
ncbi:MAG: histidine--tRNA ligase [Candidatus Alcyoniella australis]|nr:histidine--tRNA ligase [Candidatus Alcyoniella australis]